MKKTFISLILLVICIISLSCIQSQEKMDEDMVNMTMKLLECDWKLHNMKITYENYCNEVENFFIDKDTFNNHIKNVLNPLVMEDITSIDQSTIDKYKKVDYKDYDMASVKISDIYTDDLANAKYIFVSAVISPYSIQNIYDTGVVFTDMNYSSQEERNIQIKFVQTNKKKWLIESYECNSYLLSLKDKLSKEFIDQYTTFFSEPVTYTKETKFINP